MCVCDISVLMAAGCKCGDVAKTINHDEVVALVDKIITFREKLTTLFAAVKQNQFPVKELQDACAEYESIEAMAGKKYHTLVEGINTDLDNLSGTMY